jgi:hypothetical protein
MVNGKSVTVVYNVDRGCYGYPGSTLGAFIAYDMMSDSIMRNRYMARNNYMVQPVVAVVPVAVQPVVVVRTGPNYGAIIFWTLVIGGILVVCIVINKKSKDADDVDDSKDSKD